MHGPYRVEREVVNGYLQGASNDPNRFLVDQVLPGVSGPVRGSIITDNDIEVFGGDPDDTALVLPGGQIGRGEMDYISKVTYECQSYKRAYAFADEDVAESQLPIGLLQRGAKKALHYLKVKQEIRLFNVLHNTAWVHDPGDPGNGEEWDNGGDPHEQIDDAVDAMLIQEGLTGIIDYAGWNALIRNSSVLGTLRTDADRSRITPQRWLEAYGYERGFERLIVSKNRKNISKNPTSRSLSRILPAGWMWIGLLNPGTGYSSTDGDIFVNSTAVARVVAQDFTSEMFRDEDHDATVLKVKHREVIKAVDTNMGALLTSFLA